MHIYKLVGIRAGKFLSVGGKKRFSVVKTGVAKIVFAGKNILFAEKELVMKIYCVERLDIFARQLFVLFVAGNE